jgi:hypothetical protein
LPIAFHAHQKEQTSHHPSVCNYKQLMNVLWVLGLPTTPDQHLPSLNQPTPCVPQYTMKLKPDSGKFRDRPE